MKNLRRFGLIGLLVFFCIAPVWAENERDKEDAREPEPETEQEVIKAPESSFQLVLIGTVLSADRYHHTVTIRDKRRRVKTYYVNPGLMGSLTAGAMVQMRLQPGSNKVESIQKISG